MKRNLAPCHPGEILREEYIEERGYTIAAVASKSGIAESDLRELISEKISITPDFAQKLSHVFGNTAQFWINLQHNYDLWYAGKNVVI